MNQESMEELVVLVTRMKEIVEGDPSMTIRIGNAVSLLEAAVREHMENRIWRMYRETKRLRANERHTLP